MNLSYANLKSRHRELRDRFPQSLTLRTHRALSWLERSEQEIEDSDAKFIFLWIAFNAAYANEIHNREQFSERRLFFTFLKKLIDTDHDNLFYTSVWDNFSTPIRLLINNKYVFQPFWDFHNGKISQTEWLEQFEHSKSVATTALGRMKMMKFAVVMFDRLYVLRNQLMHGGATWNSSANRDQIRDGANIMSFLVPIIIHLMMEHPEQLWGDPCYPVID